ncbi:MAG: hypothetical protein MUP16_08385, partial [Sedimentisphaerales bacterium]|nr:hypothetical protein [Sedimentisphaerales bacterium]
RIEEQKAADKLFADYSKRIGISQREQQLLLAVVSKSGLKRKEGIFTIDGAFARGAAELIEESLSRESDEESEQLGAELAWLGEKLGFRKRPMPSTGRLSTRQISVGKKLYVTRSKSRRIANIESVVIKNTDAEITIELVMPVESAPGSFWRGRCYYDASVWEFDTSAISSNGNILVLNHSDKIRFVNRRRFLRVDVRQPAFVACYPFARMQSNVEGPPEFVPGLVTELAGPGLRIEAPLQVKEGDRVLVIFRLDEEKIMDSIHARRNGKTTRAMIVEDIGIVRHTGPAENGFSIAVELIGLSDADINELIRATNEAFKNSRYKGPHSARSQIRNSKSPDAAPHQLNPNQELNSEEDQVSHSGSLI